LGNLAIQCPNPASIIPAEHKVRNVVGARKEVVGISSRSVVGDRQVTGGVREGRPGNSTGSRSGISGNRILVNGYILERLRVSLIIPDKYSDHIFGCCGRAAGIIFHHNVLRRPHCDAGCARDAW
jgi:hypothetical protein